VLGRASRVLTPGTRAPRAVGREAGRGLFRVLGESSVFSFSFYVGKLLKFTKIHGKKPENANLASYRVLLFQKMFMPRVSLYFVRGLIKIAYVLRARRFTENVLEACPEYEVFTDGVPKALTESLASLLS
jgi:hypothetical protein